MKYTSRCRAHYAYSHFRAQPQSRCSNYNRATRAAERSARSTAPLTLGLPCLDPNGSPMSVRSSDPNTNYLIEHRDVNKDLLVAARNRVCVCVCVIFCPWTIKPSHPTPREAQSHGTHVTLLCSGSTKSFFKGAPLADPIFYFPLAFFFLNARCVWMKEKEKCFSPFPHPLEAK